MALRTRRKRWPGRFWIFRGKFDGGCWLAGGWLGRRSGGRHGGGIVDLSWRSTGRFTRGGGCAKSFRDPPKHYVLFPKIPIKRQKN
jgi:hypothetical protein